MKGIYFLFSIFFFLPLVASAQVISGDTPGQFVQSFYNFTLLAAGALAFGAIVYGGILYTFAAGNPSKQSEGKDWVKSALLGLLLLAGAGLILRTINPALVNLEALQGLPGIGPPGGGGCPPEGCPPQENNCDNPQQLAADHNNALYPMGDSPELTNLMGCIASKTNAGFTTYTFEQSNDLCNYTRGRAECGPCSHRVDSCHYGGAGGTNGSLAVDYVVVGLAGQNIVNAAVGDCGVPREKARCENSAGSRVECN
ncbi:MAG: hypothetical protein AAB897_02705, partial [Patescibacteria group bacterium]